jgi:two-component system NtrC family sensor kinase
MTESMASSLAHPTSSSARAEREAPRSEFPSGDLLRALAGVSPVPLLISRKHDGQILYYNAKMAEFVGTTTKELVGKSTLDFYYDPSERASVLSELEEHGRVRDREVRLKTPSSLAGACSGGLGINWAIVNIEPLELAGDSLLLAAFHDVTERKRAEQRLQESEARFRGFVENASDLVFALDDRSLFTYVSPNVQRILGYTPQQLLGQSLDSLVHANDLPQLWQSTELTRETGAVQPKSEFRMRHKDGSTHWFCSTLVPLLDAGGTIFGLTGTAHDVTQEKCAMLELEHANQNLRYAQRELLKTEKMASLGLLMAGIAHEIRTPLGAVSSTHSTMAQALEKLVEHLHASHPQAVCDNRVDRLLKVVRDAARVVGDGSARVTEIVQRLRKFSCADEAKACSVDVNAILEDTLALVHHELKHHVVLERRFGEGVTLTGYPGRLNQVLVNLLVNAAHAVRVRGRGKIGIETCALNDSVEIRISDDGVGIPAENLPRIFSSGFTTKQDQGGSGLGLAICKEIVDAHHGSLEVSSEVGRGTTFTVKLPRTLVDRRGIRGCRFS